MSTVADTAMAGAGTSFALATIEDMALAVPTDQLVQAMPWPNSLSPVPRRQGAVEGVFMFRGQVLPLVDLRSWLHSHSWTSEKLTQVIVLRSGTRSAALAVGQLSALVRAQVDQVHRVHHDEETEEFFHSVLVMDPTLPTANVLDVDALLDQVAVWSQASSEAAMTGSDPSPSSEGQLTDLQCLVQLADTSIGLAATEVGEVLNMPPIQRLGIPGSRVFGLMMWRGRNVPVVDLLGALNLPGDGGLGNPQLLVLHALGKCLAFPVSQALAVQRFTLANVQTLEPTSDGHLTPYASLLLESGQRAQLLRAQDLLAHWTISDISEGSTSSQDVKGAPLSPRESISTVASAVFDAGQQWAASLDQIEEILEFPASFSPVKSARSNVLGTFDWRKQALPLLDLRAELGFPPIPVDADTRVIVVRAKGQLAAMVVDDMQALIPSNLGTLSDLAIGRGVTIQMVTTGSGADQRSYRMMQFEELPYFARSQAG